MKKKFSIVSLILVLVFFIALCTGCKKCEHRDANDDGICDNEKCGKSFEDGKDLPDAECEHRDANDDGICDNEGCGKNFEDGKDLPDAECKHRDANDDGICDNEGCGKNFEDGDDLPSGHTCTEAERRENQIDPTCVANGSYELVIYCLECEKELSRTTIVLAKLPHSSSEWIVDKDPTCTEEGQRHKICEDCGQLMASESVTLLGHNYQITEDIAATCTQDGHLTYTCQFGCGATKEQIYFATGHSFSGDFTCDACGFVENHEHVFSNQEVVEPTCTELGYTIFTCACGYSQRGDLIEQKGHHWNDGVVDVAKTCSADGIMRYSCVDCEAEYTTPIKASHDWSETITQAPTCAENGSAARTCNSCGLTEGVVIPADHTWGETITVKPGSCTESGAERKVCAICGIIEEHTTEAKGHQYHNGICKVCGGSITDGVTPYPEHPEYGMYFEIDDIISRYGPDYINEYGVLLDYNQGANIQKVAVFLTQEGNMWRRCIAVVGTNISYATYVPYLSYDEDIKYTGLNSDWINTFPLKKNADGIWCYNNYVTIGVNLEDKYGNLLLSLYDIGQAGAKTRVFNDLDEMIAWLLSDCDEHIASDWIFDSYSTCTANGSLHKECINCGEILERESLPIMPHTSGEKEYIRNDTGICDCEWNNPYFTTCIYCGIIISSGEDGAPGHVFTVWEPVVNIGGGSPCESDVIEISECDVCDCCVGDRVVASAPGHTYVNGTCEVCGKIDPNYTPDEPKYSQGLSYMLQGDEYWVSGWGTCTDTRVIIPPVYNSKPVTGIYYSAFWSASHIDSTSQITFVIPHSITNIHYGSANMHPFAMRNGFIAGFEVDASNPSYSSINGSLYTRDGGTLIAYATGKADELFTVPSDVSFISYGAFYNAKNLHAVVISTNVTEIGFWAFRYCSSLAYFYYMGTASKWTQINTSSAVEELTAAGTFYYSETAPTTEGNFWHYVDGVPTVWSAYVAPENPGYSVGLQYTSNGDGTCYVSGIGTCTDAEIVIPPVSPDGWSVTSIGDYAFANQENIISVIIPNSAKYIRIGAFSGCTNLISIDIPNSVMFLEFDAFRYCHSLKTVFIPENVSNIGMNAFSNCKSLSNISVSENNSMYKSVDGNLYSKDGKAFIQYAIAKTDKKFTIPAGVEQIDLFSFSDCESLNSIIISDGVSYIGSDVFSWCKNLTEIIIPDSLTTIEHDAFNHCESLTTIYYIGSIEQWNTIYFSYGNDFLINATRYYYSETAPTTEGNFWHYVDGVPTVWPAYDAPENPSYSQELEYTLSNDGTYYIVTGIGTYTSRELVIPSEYNGLPVKEIAASSFENHIQLTSITIPESINIIGSRAFAGCTMVTSIYYNAIHCEAMGTTGYSYGSFVSIGEGTTGATLYVGAKVEIIPGQAFSYFMCGNGNPCNIIKVVFAENSSCEVIDYYAFDYCKNLETINFPDGLKHIAESAFYGCSKLTITTLPDSLESVESSSFTDCNITYNEYNGCSYIATLSNPYFALVGCLDKSSSNITVHADTKIITDYAFSYSDNLVSITLPTGLKKIGSGAFYYCKNLSDITIPNTVTTIEDSAFTYCSKITSIVIPDSVTTFGSYVFSNCSALTTIVFPKRIDNIGILYFYECNNLTSINIPYGVTEIGSSAFDYCYKLASVIIPDSVTCIGSRAFNACYALTSIVIPDSVTNIDDSAFRFSGIDSIIIPSSVKHISSNAFAYSSLRSITFEDNNSLSLDYNVFYECDQLQTINVGKGISGISYDMLRYCHNLQFNEYDNAYYLGNVNNPYTLLIKLRSSDVTSCIIHKDAINISSSAFSEGYNLTYIVIGSNITNIEYYTFSSCYNLSYIILEDGLTNISSGAFACISGLKSIVLPNTITSLGSGAFSDCYNLTSAVLSEGMKVIDSCTFYFCTSLKSVVIPKSITEIQALAFNDCSSLTDIYYTGSAEEWAKMTIESVGNEYLLSATVHFNADRESLLGYSKGLEYTSNGDGTCYVSGIGACNDTQIIIPAISPSSEIVIGIGRDAFAGCNSIISIEIPDTIVSVGKNAFYNCTSLNSVYTKSIEKWLEIEFKDAFSNPLVYADNLCVDEKAVNSVIVPESITKIGSFAFYGSSISDIILHSKIESIGSYAFSKCNKLNAIYYSGSASDWLKISIELSTNESLTNASLYYYSEYSPATEGKFWHYVDGEPTAWPVYIVPNYAEIPGTNSDYSNGLAFTSNGDGTCYVSGIGSCTDSTIVIPPTSPDGDQVTRIGDCAFSFEGNDFIKSVVIPEGVTVIGYDAFYTCRYLESIVIPSTLQSSSGSSFYDCPSIRQVFISDLYAWCFIEWWNGYEGGNPMSYGSHLYLNGKLVTELVIPDNVTTIKTGAFSGGLFENVIIPSGVKHIEYMAFGNCKALTDVLLHNDIVSMSKYSFEGCELLNYAIYDNCKYLGTANNPFLFLAAPIDSNIQSVAIHNDTKFICDEAFSSCKQLKSVTIPNGVEYIGDHAFSGCELLESIILPDSVRRLGNGTFWCCDSLYSVILSKNISRIGSMTFAYCESLGSITLHEGIVEIADSAFLYCESLYNVNIPGSVIRIGSSAFYHSGISNLVLGKNIEFIGREAFDYCYGLSSVVISTGFKNTDRYSIFGNSSIGTIYYKGTRVDWINNNMDSWGYYYFTSSPRYYYSESAPVVNGNFWHYVDGQPTKWPEYILESPFLPDGNTEDSKGLVYVSNGDGTCYVSDIGTCTDRDIVIPKYSPTGDKVIAIGANAFATYNTITSVTIPEGVESINANAFYQCQNLTKLVLPASLRKIECQGFYEGTNISEIVFADPYGWYYEYAPDTVEISAETLSDPISAANAFKTYPIYYTYVYKNIDQ